MTKFPNDDCYAPLQLSKDQSENVDLACRIAPILPASQTHSVGGFGRQAQAIYLLNKAFFMLQNDDQDRRTSALIHLDEELQYLLTITMGEYRGPGSHCGANATALRYTLPSL